MHHFYMEWLKHRSIISEATLRVSEATLRVSEATLRVSEAILWVSEAMLWISHGNQLVVPTLVIMTP
jgi:hypothetical protein